MGHYAELNASRVVQRVVVASDLAWVQANLTGTWVEVTKDTSDYRGIGYTFGVSNAPAPSGGDDTTALNAWISAATARSIMSFQTNGSYRVDGTLTIDTKSKLTFLGNNATLTATTTGDAARCHVLVIDSDHITFKGLNIVGANPDPGVNGAGAQGLESQHGFTIKSSNNVTIDACTVTAPYADFVYMNWKTSGAAWATAVAITNCTFDGNGRQGIAVVAGDNIRIVGNSMTEVRRAWVDLEPNSVDGGATNIEIAYNTIGTHRLNGLASGGYGGNIGNVHVHHNSTITGEGWTVVIDPPDGAQRRGPFWFHDNVIDGAVGSDANPGAHWSFNATDDIRLERNTVPVSANRNMVPFAFTGCTDIKANSNVCAGATTLYFIDGVQRDDLP